MGSHPTDDVVFVLFARNTVRLLQLLHPRKTVQDGLDTLRDLGCSSDGSSWSTWSNTSDAPLAARAVFVTTLTIPAKRQPKQKLFLVSLRPNDPASEPICIELLDPSNQNHMCRRTKKSLCVFLVCNENQKAKTNTLSHIWISTCALQNKTESIKTVHCKDNTKGHACTMSASSPTRRTTSCPHDISDRVIAPPCPGRRHGLAVLVTHRARPARKIHSPDLSFEAEPSCPSRRRRQASVFSQPPPSLTPSVLPRSSLIFSRTRRTPSGFSRPPRLRGCASCGRPLRGRLLPF